MDFDAQITVIARLVQWEYRLKISYEILDDSGRRTTTGETVQVAVSIATGEMQVGAPEVLRECVGAYLRRPGEAP